MHKLHQHNTTITILTQDCVYKHKKAVKADSWVDELSCFAWRCLMSLTTSVVPFSYVLPTAFLMTHKSFKKITSG